MELAVDDSGRDRHLSDDQEALVRVCYRSWGAVSLDLVRLRNPSVGLHLVSDSVRFSECPGTLEMDTREEGAE